MWNSKKFPQTIKSKLPWKVPEVLRSLIWTPSIRTVRFWAESRTAPFQNRHSKSQTLCCRNWKFKINFKFKTKFQFYLLRTEFGLTNFNCVFNGKAGRQTLALQIGIRYEFRDSQAVSSNYGAINVRVVAYLGSIFT